MPTSTPMPDKTNYVYDVMIHLESWSEPNKRFGPYRYDLKAGQARITASEQHLNGLLLSNPGFHLHKLTASRITGEKLTEHLKSAGQLPLF